MAEAFESLGLRGLGSVGSSLPNPGVVEKPRLEVLKKLDIIHCRRCLAALEEDGCIWSCMAIKMIINMSICLLDLGATQIKNDCHDMFNPLKLPMGYPIPGEPLGFRKTWSTLQWSHTGVLALKRLSHSKVTQLGLY